MVRRLRHLGSRLAYFRLAHFLEVVQGWHTSWKWYTSWKWHTSWKWGTSWRWGQQSKACQQMSLALALVVEDEGVDGVGMGRAAKRTWRPASSRSSLGAGGVGGADGVGGGAQLVGGDVGDGGAPPGR